MADFYDYYDIVKRYFVFDPLESRSLLITSLILAFCLSFRQWGVGNVFSVRVGLFNFFNAFVIVLLALFINISAKKLYALHLGYKVRYEFWVFGLVFALLLTFVTNGVLFFLAVGGFSMSIIKGYRLGFFRHGLNYFALGVVSFMGILANIALAAFFRFFNFTNSPIVQEAIVVNLMVAAFALVPIPPLDGVKIFFASPFLYAFTVGLLLGAWIFIYAPAFWIFLLGTLISAFVALYFMIKYEDPFFVK